MRRIKKKTPSRKGLCVCYLSSRIDKGRPSERIKYMIMRTHRRVAFLPAMMEQARSFAGWPGSIEVGPKKLHCISAHR